MHPILSPPVKDWVQSPLRHDFRGIEPGMMVEVPNCDYADLVSTNRGVYWPATIVELVGFRARLRYVGCGESNDFWMNMVSQNVHHIGYSAANACVLVPPKFMAVSFVLESRSISPQ